MLAACTFDYGIPTERLNEFATQFRINVLGRRVPLPQAVECGVTGALLALIGIQLPELLALYLLEDVVAMLRIDWLTLKLLKFSPLLLADTGSLPLIVLHDLVGLTASHLFEFELPREALELTLGESGVALLRLNGALWPKRRVGE